MMNKCVLGHGISSRERGRLLRNGDPSEFTGQLCSSRKGLFRPKHASSCVGEYPRRQPRCRIPCQDIQCSSYDQRIGSSSEAPSALSSHLRCRYYPRRSSHALSDRNFLLSRFQICLQVVSRHGRHPMGVAVFWPRQASFYSTLISVYPSSFSPIDI